MGQHGHDGDAEAEQHVDADEDFVLGAAVRVGVVNVEQDQRHQGQQVVERGDRQQSCGDNRTSSCGSWFCRWFCLHHTPQL